MTSSSASVTSLPSSASPSKSESSIRTSLSDSSSASTSSGGKSVTTYSAEYKISARVQCYAAAGAMEPFSLLAGLDEDEIQWLWTKWCEARNVSPTAACGQRTFSLQCKLAFAEEKAPLLGSARSNFLADVIRMMRRSRPDLFRRKTLEENRSCSVCGTLTKGMQLCDHLILWESPPNPADGFHSHTRECTCTHSSVEKKS